MFVSKHLSDEEYAEIYGKCNNPNGHGHNYTGRLHTGHNDVRKILDCLVFGGMFLKKSRETKIAAVNEKQEITPIMPRMPMPTFCVVLKVSANTLGGTGIHIYRIKISDKD
ncbi:hypothetical protein GQX74_000174 [Glossina fuscipes]|nr:hypothetical protein GQX74_000174 [Glossina fuscipes]